MTINSQITVSADHTMLIESDTNHPFILWGVNYFRPNTGWPPQFWHSFAPNETDADFARLAEVGINTLRVFFAAKTFMPQPGVFSPDALSMMDTLVKLADKHGLHLVMAGPDHWEGVPEYFRTDEIATDTALAAVEHFWVEICRRYAGHRAILAWSLRNEPMVHWQSSAMQEKWVTWVRHNYRDIHTLRQVWDDVEGHETLSPQGYVAIPPNEGRNEGETGFARLRDYQRFRDSIGCAWVQRQVEAIRSVDTTHLVTVGLIQWSLPFVRAHWGSTPNAPSWYAGFDPLAIAPYLDYMSIHFYPILGDPADLTLFNENTSYLQAWCRYAKCGLPIVVEEYGWHGGNTRPGEDLAQREARQVSWNKNVITSTAELACGWLNWAYADTPEATDCTVASGLFDANCELKSWGKELHRLKEQVSAAKSRQLASQVAHSSGTTHSATLQNQKRALIKECAITARDPRPLLAEYIAMEGI